MIANNGRWLIMIEVSNLTKNYGDRTAISHLNFKIEKGDVVGLLGPNGAGKSTTMKIITGFMSPTSGVARIGGFDVFENPIEVKKKIGYLPETPPLYLDMTIEDYLHYVAELKLVPAAEIKKNIERSLLKTQLLSVRKRLIRNLSKGFKQRVGIAQALVSNPEVLVLDEPTVGLDPKQVAEIRELIKELKGSHTIILSTHILSEVQATCNKVIIIHQGKIVAQDSIDQLEKLNQGFVTLNLKTRIAKGIKSNLEKIEGVQSVLTTDDLTYIIEMSDRAELTDEIAAEVLKSGAGLVELIRSKNQLEDVFLRLTYGQGADQRADHQVTNEVLL
jgi:ABC-2 type transport system ATP-binding protein